jgi:transposase
LEVLRKRTKLLQEVRKMRFGEAYGYWKKRSFTQEEAARLLGVSDRTFRRYINRYEEKGIGNWGTFICK